MDSNLVHSKFIAPLICPDQHDPLSGNRSSSLHMFDLSLSCFDSVCCHWQIVTKGGAHPKGCSFEHIYVRGGAHSQGGLF